MSHTKVKTQYASEGPHAITEDLTLYCHHNHTCDCTVFYDADGKATQMVFNEWESGNDLWDAMLRLMHPYKDEWGGELKEGVEHYKEVGD
ncbi:hypothetical protein LEM8419_03515 [Neolewinella maritima]|uniref:KTSC domain-containing protein n=1 Tax=Neolewinella maritima TaxID=1383882 RepID=A0ABN8FE74_9BACT|nr:hypothetical protein [Neolewinella maritima]CAH1002643.1 hypothetical protein LEM8419_03515 [Neolewinella maritima]